MNIDQIVVTVKDNIAVVAMGVIVAQALMLVLLIIQFRALNLQRKRYLQLTSGQDGKNLEQVLLGYAAEVGITRQEIRDLSVELQSLRHLQQGSYQKLGFVRYNALPDVRGDLSFSMALLDGQNCGILISSIYGREEARVYGRKITLGKAVSSLSKEEEKALEQALSGKAPD